MKHKFSDFSVGDLIFFNKTFKNNDYKKFAEISKDFNPLHHNNKYALKYGDGHNIVPLHLIISPISRIAGMNFPGTPSLYLDHTVRAINQLHYGELITYSAKITSINVNKRILAFRVLGLSENKLIFDAQIQTHSLRNEWEQKLDFKIIKNSSKKRVFITGASGEIATSIAKIFQDNGWLLLLQQRGDEKLKNNITEYEKNSKNLTIKANLNNKKDLKKVLKTLGGLKDLKAIIHTASPPITGNLNDLVNVNYTALKSITEQVLPQMLINQDGVIALLGSSAMITQVDGFEDYAASKSMAANYLAGIDKKYSFYGVEGKVHAPTFVSTKYSKKFRGKSQSLIPSEVAVEVFDLINQSKDFMRIQNIGSVVNGKFGFSNSRPLNINNQEYSNENPKTKQSKTINYEEISERLIFCLKKVLPKSSDEDISEGGMGITPGWDSLAQIQIMLEVEKEFKIKFTSEEFESLRTFEDLLKNREFSDS